MRKVCNDWFVLLFLAHVLRTNKKKHCGSVSEFSVSDA